MSLKKSFIWLGQVITLCIVQQSKLVEHRERSGVLGVCMWQGSGRLSKVGGFLRVLRFPPPRMTTECQHPRLRECIFKFFELSV